MTAVRWRPPAGVEADPVAIWVCAAARRLVPDLGAESHALVHAVANALADDLMAHGEPPVELIVEAEEDEDELAISVTDARNCSAKIIELLADGEDGIQSLTRGLTVRPTVGFRGCTLRTVIPIRRTGRRTLRSRLTLRRRGRR